MDDKIFSEIARLEREHPWLKGKRIQGVADPSIWAGEENGISIAFQILASTVFSGLVKAGSVDLIVQSIEDLAQSAPGVVRVANSSVGSALLLEVLQGAVLYVITSLSLSKKLNLA